MNAQWEQAAAQWRANRRLRIAVGLALLFVLAHIAFARGDAVEAQAADYWSERNLLVRLEGAAADASWTARADEAEEAREALEAQLAAVAGSGEAQAELQALLTAAATSAGVTQPSVRTEGAIAVEGLPGVLEVSGRLAGGTTAAASHALLSDLAGRSWVRVERIDLRDGSPGDLQMIVRAYYRLDRAEVAP
jgi:hypothetical protein